MTASRKPKNEIKDLSDLCKESKKLTKRFRLKIEEIPKLSRLIAAHHRTNGYKGLLRLKDKGYSAEEIISHIIIHLELFDKGRPIFMAGHLFTRRDYGMNAVYRHALDEMIGYAGFLKEREK